MNASGQPQQPERCIDAYVAVWNEPDAGLRLRMLTQVMAEDGTYLDPIMLAPGHAALADYIGQVQSRYPGARIVRTSTVDTHHQACRFNWCVVKADGTRLPESVDFVEFADDGRILRVTGFFGPPVAHPPAP